MPANSASISNRRGNEHGSYRAPPGPSSTANAIPMTDQNNPAKFPVKEHEEYPKMVHKRTKEGKPTTEPFLDESNQIALVYDEDDEAQFLADHPNACVTAPTVVMSGEEAQEQAARIAELEAENIRLKAEKTGTDTAKIAPKSTTSKPGVRPNPLARATTARPTSPVESVEDAAEEEPGEVDAEEDTSLETTQELPGKRTVRPMLGNMPKNLK